MEEEEKEATDDSVEESKANADEDAASETTTHRANANANEADVIEDPAETDAKETGNIETEEKDDTPTRAKPVQDESLGDAEGDTVVQDTTQQNEKVEADSGAQPGRSDETQEEAKTEATENRDVSAVDGEASGSSPSDEVAGGEPAGEAEASVEASADTTAQDEGNEDASAEDARNIEFTEASGEAGPAAGEAGESNADVSTAVTGESSESPSDGSSEKGSAVQGAGDGDTETKMEEAKVQA